MTPSADASLTVSAAGTLANRGVRQFTVATGAATQVDIQLYPADNVTVATSGVVKFADTDNNLIADPGTVDGALITAVNGVGNNSYRADNVTPVNGQVTFTVNGTVAQSVIPAVYADYTTANNGLDLVANVPSDKLPKVPAEAFGIGGMTTWAPAEAAAFSQVLAGEVVSVDVANQSYQLDNDGSADVTVKWAAGDTFKVDADGTNDSTGVAANQAQFTSWISAGDTMAEIGSYNPDADAQFIMGDFPNAPTAVTAAVVAGEVTVDFTKPTNAISHVAAGTFQLQRATVTSGVVGAYSDVESAITNISTTSPEMVNTTDQIALTFSEKVTLAADASFTFRDADGSVGTISRGGNATMGLNSAGTIAFITLTGVPVPEALGSPVGLDIDGANETVISSTGVADVAGNLLADSPLVGSLGTTAGPAAGGQSVVITGSGLTGATAVTFGCHGCHVVRG